MKLINGEDYHINLNSELLKQHFADPYNYTKEIMAQFDTDYYKPFISKKDKVILDIGANVGLFTLHVHPFADRIICVEPTPSHAEKLKEIISQYTKTPEGGEKFIKVPKVSVENSALSDHTGTTTFHWCGINTTMCSLQPRGDRSFEVPCITLPDLLDKYKLDKVNFAKIDIEGSEHTAITTEILKACYDRIDRIFIELHPIDSITQEKFKVIFEEAGYKVEKHFHDSLVAHK